MSASQTTYEGTDGSKLVLIFSEEGCTIGAGMDGHDIGAARLTNAQVRQVAACILAQTNVPHTPANTSMNTPMSTDMVFGACVALMWATNTCDDEQYDLASAVAGVEATLDSEDITLTELWTRLAGDLTRRWERSLPLPEWWL